MIMASGPISLWQIDGETMKTVTDFIFLGSKITTDVDCSHEIKRCLFPGRKAMTNLNSIFKSRNVTWPMKTHLINAMVFLIVMYRCESWTNHKEGWAPKNWCFWIVVLEKTFESTLNSKEITPVNPKGNEPWILTEGLMLKLKLQHFGHPMQRTNSLEKTLMLGKTAGKRRSEWQRMKWSDSITDSIDMILNKLWQRVEDRGAWHVTVYEVAESDTT